MTLASSVTQDVIPPELRHLPVVVWSRRLRDGFRLRYRVRCWHCDLDIPHRTVVAADLLRADVDAGRAGGSCPWGST